MLNKKTDELLHRHSPIARRNTSSWSVGKSNIGSLCSRNTAIMKYSPFRDRRSFSISSDIRDSEIFIRKIFTIMHIPFYGEKRVKESIKGTRMGKNREVAGLGILLKMLLNSFLKVINKKESPSLIEHLKREALAMFPFIKSFCFKRDATGAN